MCKIEDSEIKGNAVVRGEKTIISGSVIRDNVIVGNSEICADSDMCGNIEIKDCYIAFGKVYEGHIRRMEK